MINTTKPQGRGGTECCIVSKIEKSPKRWTKPELTKLGTLRDVAGNRAINFNGSSGNNADFNVS